MGEVKHTEERWALLGFDVGDGCVEQYVMDDKGNEVAFLNAWAPEFRADRERHARLIAAAPTTAAERDRLKATVAELVVALEYVEEILGFHEGGEELIGARTKPCVVINAQGDDGDFQNMLAKIRAALSRGKATGEEHE